MQEGSHFASSDKEADVGGDQFNPLFRPKLSGRIDLIFKHAYQTQMHKSRVNFASSAPNLTIDHDILRPCVNQVSVFHH